MACRQVKYILLLSVVFLSVFNTNLAIAFRLPHTGLTTCYNSLGSPITCAGSGQDGDYLINALSYTDNGNGTVTDDNTGLMWQKEDDGNVYMWDQAETYCSNLVLGGYSDWRVPGQQELLGIVDYSVPEISPAYLPRVDSVFSNAQAAPYWAHEEFAGQPLYQAWYVNFEYGYNAYGLKNQYFSVRCVRGSSLIFGDFTNNPDNVTVTDNQTRLMWQKGDLGYDTWNNAIAACENLSLGGYSDWRLPNVKEIATLFDASIESPSIDPDFFPTTVGNDYWATTTEVDGDYDRAWYGAFYYNGSVGRDSKNVYSRYIRCVRNLDQHFSLTVSASNANGGSGTVASSPAGIDCGPVCKAYFLANSTVNLIPIPAENGSFFTGWGGSGCVSGVVTMSAARSCTAYFNWCTPVKLGSDYPDPTVYSLQTAYNKAQFIDHIYLTNSTITDSLDAEASKYIQIAGGYDCNFQNTSGFTTVSGSIKIGQGTVILSNLIIK